MCVRAELDPEGKQAIVGSACDRQVTFLPPTTLPHPLGKLSRARTQEVVTRRVVSARSRCLFIVQPTSINPPHYLVSHMRLTLNNRITGGLTLTLAIAVVSM